MMRCQRDLVLASFLRSKALTEYLELTPEELAREGFSERSEHLVIEAIKAMLVAYCNDEPELTVIRAINNKIKAAA